MTETNASKQAMAAATEIEDLYWKIAPSQIWPKSQARMRRHARIIDRNFADLKAKVADQQQTIDFLKHNRHAMAEIGEEHCDELKAKVAELEDRIADREAKIFNESFLLSQANETIAKQQAIIDRQHDNICWMENYLTEDGYDRWMTRCRKQESTEQAARESGGGV